MAGPFQGHRKIWQGHFRATSRAIMALENKLEALEIDIFQGHKGYFRAIKNMAGP